MSRRWDVHCVTCTDTLRIGENTRDYQVNAVIASAGPLADLSKTMVGGDIEVKGCYHWTLDVDWFDKHRGHKLAPIDEYGTIDGNCRHPVHCYCCHASSRRCVLLDGHGGPHVAEAAK